MSYSDLFEKARKSGKTKSVTPQWFPFEKVGDFVLGKLVGINEVVSSLGQGTYRQYVMDTDAGLIKFSLGAATDKELSSVLHDGGVYRLEYIGEVKIKGGKRVNKFRCEALMLEAEEPGVTDDDIPF